MKLMYLLSYVNSENGSYTDYDMEFESMDGLIGFVQEKHPDFTSYDVIVIKED